MQTRLFVSHIIIMSVGRQIDKVYLPLTVQSTPFTCKIWAHQGEGYSSTNANESERVRPHWKCNPWNISLTIFFCSINSFFFQISLSFSAVISRWKDIRNSLRKHFISNASIFLSPFWSAESKLHCRIAWWERPGTCVSMNFVSKLLLLLFHMLFSLAIVVTSVIL